MATFADYLPALAVAGAIAAGLLVSRSAQWLERTRLGRSGFKQKPLLTPNEVDFYHRLRQALGARWVVFPQVSMGALMDTRLEPAHGRYWAEREQFASKICDFVVCDAKGLKPVLIVELDDVMHDFNKDRRRDSLVCRAGYRTVRFWSRKKPTTQELKVLLDKELALN